MAEMEVRARFVASVSEAVAQLKRLQQSVEGVEASSNSAGGGMQKAIGMFTRFGVMATAALGSAATAAGVMGIKTAAANEQALISFQTLLGSQEKAAKMFADLQSFAATTPFEFPQLRDAASKLLTTGVAAERVLPIMTALGDSTAAMGTGAEGIGRAVYALQQMNTAGRVTGQDMMQLASAGIPVWDALAASIGKSVPEVRELASEGALVANDVMTAIETYAGPAMSRVKGMMEVQSQSMMGLMSTLKDTIAIELGRMMQPAADELKKALPQLITMVGDTLTAIGPSINKMVAAIFGTLQKLLPLLTPIFIGIGELIAVAMDALGQGLEMVLPYIDQLAPLMSNVATIAKNLFDAFMPLVATLIGMFVPVVIQIVNVAAGMAKIIGENADMIKKLTPLIVIAVGALVAYKTAMAAVGIAKFITSLGLQMKALWLSVQAQGALNTVTMLFPGIWIAAAIAAVIAAIYLLVKNWDWVVDKLKWAWNWIVDIVQKGINLVLGYYEWWTNKTIDAVNFIIKAWNKLPFGDDIDPLKHVNFELDITGAKLDRTKEKAEATAAAVRMTADNAERLANGFIAANNAAAAVNAQWDKMRMRNYTPAGTGDKPDPTGGGGGISKAAEEAKKRLDALKDSMEKVTDAVKDFSSSVGGAMRDALGIQTVFSADKAKASLDAMNDRIAKTKKITPELVTEFQNLTKTLGNQMVEALEKAKQSLDDAKQRFESFRKSVSDAIMGAFGTLTTAYQSATEAQKAYASAQKEVASASERVSAAQERESDARKALNDLLADPETSASALATAQERLAEAIRDTATATGELAAAQKAEGSASSEASKSFLTRLKEQAQAALTFTDQIKKLIALGLSENALQQVLSAGVEAGGKIATELITGGQTVIDETNRLIESAQKAADEVGLTAASKWYQAGVDNATEQINGLVAQIATLTPDVMKAMDTLAAKMKRQAKIDIKVSQTKFDVDVFVTKHIREVVSRETINIAGARAAGGPVSAGRTYLVGERGPELFTPNQSGGITPNNAIGGSITVNVTAGMGADGGEIGDQIVEALKRYQRRNGSVPITVS